MLVWINQHIVLSTIIVELTPLLVIGLGALLAACTHHEASGCIVMILGLIMSWLTFGWTVYLLIKLILIDGIPCVKQIWMHGFKWHTIVPVVWDVVALLISRVKIKFSSNDKDDE